MSGDHDHSHGSIRSGARHKGRLTAAFGLLELFMVVEVMAIGLWILPRTWRLGSRAVRILVQAAPPGTDLDAIETALAALDGVVDVHDLHVWTLTSEMDVASAHLMVRAGTDSHAVLDQARDLLRDGHHIDHATLQIEPDNHKGCDEVAW